MTWGVKWKITFDPLEVVNLISPVYTFDIMQKGWTGGQTSIVASGVPVLHSWATDDPKAAIKGSSLKLTLVNQGSNPLTAFLSNEDDMFKGIFYKGTQRLFEGFLVQDDCEEELAEWRHEIVLSFTDNLGLLKDVALNEAPISYINQFSSLEPFTSTAPHTLSMSDVFAANLAVGFRIIITGTSVDGTYTVSSIGSSSGGITPITLNETIGTGSGTGTFLVSAPTAFQQRMTLLSLVQSCLASTGLEIETHIYSNIRETTQSALITFLKQTLVDSQTFLKNDTDYDDCYLVLTKILERFNMTLFQSLGVWNIVRWDELRYYNNSVPGFGYDKDFNVIGNVTLPSVFLSGIGEASVAETGLLQKVFRPYLFDKETFNYRQPVQLLRNYNLQELGALRTTFTSGTGINLITTSEYDFPWWVWENIFPTAGSASVYFIRVIKDYLGTEIERYVVVKTNDIHSYKIEVNQDDTFKLSISWRTSDSRPGSANYTFYVQLTDGTTTKYLREPLNASPGWQNGVGWVYNIASGDNANVWHTIEIDSNFAPIPFDGLLTVYLRTFTTAETQYRDLRFEYIPSINSSSKIIGHTHTDSQTGQIKNNEDVEIYVDDSPRNSIAGTLFIDSLTGLLQTKTLKWTRGHLSESKNLGEITTLEILYWRSVPRMILEGTLFGYQDFISMLSVFKYTWFNERNFVWGTLEIDYRNKLMRGTLWEIWKDSDTAPADTYEFKYLYDIK